MQIVLDVPFVTQLGYGDPANPRDDPTGCWYSSACMVGYFFGAGPRLGDPTKFKRGLGRLADGTRVGGHVATWYGEGKFMANEDLEAIPFANDRQWTADALASLLRQYGPIMFAWSKTANGHTYGHACVIIGVIGSNVVYHDPEAAPHSSMTLADFNRTLYRTSRAPMLRHGGPAYQRTPQPAPAPVTEVVKPRPHMKSNQSTIDKVSGKIGSLFR